MKRFLFFFLLMTIGAPCVAQTPVSISNTASGMNVFSVITPVDRGKVVNGINIHNGVAPLLVFADATGTTSPSTTSICFHECEFGWTWGETGAGSWTVNVGGTPTLVGGNTDKNRSYGPVAAHVYEAPGTYQACLTVSNGRDTSPPKCQTIKVSDPEQVYGSANTLCFYNTGTAAGCPGTAKQTPVLNTALATLATTGTGKRVLLRSGDAFTGTGVVNLNSSGPWTLGTYNDSGAGSRSNPVDPAVVETAPGANVIVINSAGNNTLSDIRIMDLEFNGRTTANCGVSSSRGIDNLLLLRLKVHDFGGLPFTFPGDQLNGKNTSLNTPFHLWNNLGLVSSEMYNANGSGMFMVWATRFAYLGNYVHANTLGTEGLRLQYSVRYVISNSYVTENPGGYEDITIRGDSGGHTKIGTGANPNLSQYGVVSDNYIGSNGMGLTSSPIDQITERNWFRSLATASGVGLEYANGVRMTIRNNLFDMTLGSAKSRIAIMLFTGKKGQGQPASMYPSGPFWIYNNSVFTTLKTQNGDLLGVFVRDAPTGTSSITVKNLLMYTDGVGGPHQHTYVVRGFGTPTVAGNSSDMQANAGTNPFPGTPGAPTANWKPTGSSYAIGSNNACSRRPCSVSVPVWSDFFLNTAPSPRDIGAVSH